MSESKPGIIPTLNSSPKENAWNIGRKQVNLAQRWSGLSTGLPGPSAILNNYGGSWVIYSLIAALIIGIIIVVIDIFHPFLPSNPFGGVSPNARNSKVFWKDKNGDVENLFVSKSESITTRPDVYSMTIQMFISDSRTPSLGKYRHVLHRGSNPCGITSSGSVANSGTTSYNNDGLPEIMNPGLFLDKYKNDLCVFVHTKDSTGGMLLESLLIKDLPLNQTINIGLVSGSKTLEVYVNCRLYATHLYAGIPHLPSNNNQWFGRYCAYPFLGSVSNLTLWDSPITSLDMIKLCRTSKILNAPQPCPGSAGQNCSNPPDVGKKSSDNQKKAM